MKNEDFTEECYTKLLKLAKSRYVFSDYEDTANVPLVVWRHDIDYSPNRALALARIEAKQDVKCIYHVMLTSRYYSLFEKETLDSIENIINYGHQVGLHFDVEVIDKKYGTDSDVVLDRISFEKDILERLFGIKIKSISFHNTLLNLERITDASSLLEMINVNSNKVFQSYKYVSDSNGIWREDVLNEILTGDIYQRLHVLTHPVWWTKKGMNPAERLQRAIYGRANNGLDTYFNLMKEDGRYEEVLTASGFENL